MSMIIVCLTYNSKEQTLSFELNNKFLDCKLINIPNCDDNGGLFWCVGHYRAYLIGRARKNP